MISSDQVNQRYPDQPLWRVTVKPEGMKPETVEVRSPTEGKARTNAMLCTSFKLRGQHVDYEVHRV